MVGVGTEVMFLTTPSPCGTEKEGESMRFRKKEDGAVLFNKDKSTEVRQSLREGVARTVRPQIRVIDRWLLEDRFWQDRFWI